MTDDRDIRYALADDLRRMGLMGPEPATCEECSYPADGPDHEHQHRIRLHAGHWPGDPCTPDCRPRLMQDVELPTERNTDA